MTPHLTFSHVSRLEEITDEGLRPAAEVYRSAFAGRPYDEIFTSGEAIARLIHILEQQGDLLLGKVDDVVTSLAGGYLKMDGTYYIEELAVAPDYQRQGIGRRTLDALMRIAALRDPRRFEGRTAVDNERAMALYQSAGFVAQAGTEAVPVRRYDGLVGLDERQYLSTPALDESERLRTLKRVTIVSASGNPTALVFDQLLGADRRLLHADVLLAWQDIARAQPKVEQCAFVMPARDARAVARLEMFGGEFSGNATRSAAWLVTGGRDYAGLIEASGTRYPLWFEVKDGSVTLEMPLADHVRAVALTEEGLFVSLDGMIQIVVDDPASLGDISPRQLLLRLLHENKYGLADQPAVGVSFYHDSSRSAEFCVWVRETGTILDETACGSGTAAICVASAHAWMEATRMTVTQPSGEEITAEIQMSENQTRTMRLTISGNVTTLHDGELRLR